MSSTVFGHLAPALDPAVEALIIGCFVLLFASSAINKLRDMRHFAEVLSGYHLSPLLTRWQVFRWVPCLELVVAAGLLAPSSRAVAAALGAGLLVAYALAIAKNLRAGRTSIDCGCGGPAARRPIAAWMVWRNGCLALALGASLLPRNLRGFEPTDVLTVVCGVGAIALLYSCIDRLLSQTGQPGLRRVA